MNRIDLSDFYNEGFGWICKHCERDDRNSAGSSVNSRLMSEGEAESKSPDLSTKAIAKWVDHARQKLICPRCGIVESADKF